MRSDSGEDAPVVFLGTWEEARKALQRALNGRVGAAKIEDTAKHLTALRPGWEEMQPPAPEIRIFRRISDGRLRAFQRISPSE